MHSHSRRGFLTRTLGTAWLGASTMEKAYLRAAQARAQSKAPLPVLFDLEKMADGVYAALARGRAIINCNAVVFENEKDLLIVDAHACPSAVFSLVAQLRREVSEKPVRYVVSTHLHGDHTQGLPAYKEIAPKADIISSANARQVMSELGPGRLKSAVEAVPKSIENYSRRQAAARTPEEKAYYAEMISQSRAFLEEMRSCPLELPTKTFDRELVIRDKAHDLHLSFRGRGHTAGDIVAYCPQKKVLASGDLLHSFFPVIGDGYPRDWPGTLRSIGELEFEKAAGGHGGVVQDRRRAAQFQAYFDELIETVARAKQRGRTLDQLLAEVTPASFKSLQDGGFGEYLTSEVKKRDFRLHLSTPAEVLARGFRDNISATFRNFERT